MIEMKAKGLSKRYGRLEALKNFEIEINSGDCVVLLGPNGAGKSTFLKISTNVVHPSSGFVEINGKRVDEDPMGALSSVGPLIELPEFYPYLNGKEVLSYVCKVKGADREMIKSEVNRLTDLLRMNNFMDRKTGQYSRGMKQRLALACSMAMDPKILILDEPTFGLDPRGMREFVEIIRNLNRKHGKTILFSTHLISEAREIANRVVIINGGEKKLEMKNETDAKMMRVTPYVMSDFSFLERSGVRVEYEGKEYVNLTLPDDMDNDGVISLIQRNGIRLKWAEPTNLIERKYLEMVN